MLDFQYSMIILTSFLNYECLQVEIWEAVVTFLLFPVMVLSAYVADKGLPCWHGKVNILGDNFSQKANAASKNQPACEF